MGETGARCAVEFIALFDVSVCIVAELHTPDEWDKDVDVGSCPTPIFRPGKPTGRGEKMWINIPSLQEALAGAELYEFRQPQGKRYGLQPVLLLSCVALMCGAQSEQEIGNWCKSNGKRWMKWLGIKSERGPSTATITRIFRGINGARLEAEVLLWTEQILEFLRLSTDDEWDELAVELENPESSTKRWTEGSELLLTLSGCLRTLLDRLAGCSEREDLKGRRESLLAGLVLTGYVETGDLREVFEDKASTLPQSPDKVRPGYLPVNAIPDQRWRRVAV